MVWIIMSLYGVIGYHVTLSEGHMIANYPIYGSDWLSCERVMQHLGLQSSTYISHAALMK